MLGSGWTVFGAAVTEWKVALSRLLSGRPTVYHILGTPKLIFIEGIDAARYKGYFIAIPHSPILVSNNLVRQDATHLPVPGFNLAHHGGPFLKMTR